MRAAQAQFPSEWEAFEIRCARLVGDMLAGIETSSSLSGEIVVEEKVREGRKRKKSEKEEKKEREKREKEAVLTAVLAARKKRRHSMSSLAVPGMSPIPAASSNGGSGPVASTVERESEGYC